MSRWIFDASITGASRLVDLDGDLPPSRITGDLNAQVELVKSIVGEGPVAMDFTGVGYGMARALWRMGVTVQRLGYGRPVAP